MALPERVSRDWRNNRNIIYAHNNITYSIAWKKMVIGQPYFANSSCVYCGEVY